MNVDELYEYSKWITRHANQALAKYQTLHGALNHNATQAQKLPVSEPMNSLKSELRNMPMRQLSEEGRRVLNITGTEKYFGQTGADFVDKTISLGDFDPVTAATKIAEAVTSVSEAIQRASNLSAALEGIVTGAVEASIGEDQVEVRLRFTEKAAIKDVADLKEWSSEWFTIIHGIAACVNEKPEDTRVIGASTGSLLLFLLASAKAAKLITIITCCAAISAKQLLSVVKYQKSMRHDGVMDKEIERVMKARADKLVAEAKESAISKVTEALDGQFPAGADNGLKRSVDKIFDFAEKGGETDFLLPSPSADGLTEEDDPLQDDVASVRKLVEDYRELRKEVERLKLLAAPSDLDN